MEAGILDSVTGRLSVGLGDLFTSKGPAPFLLQRKPRPRG